VREEPRKDYESVDLEDLEEVPPSVEELSAEHLHTDLHVENLLAMTGEGFSLDAQRESLKQAAKENDAQPEKADSTPSLSIPTPYDFGGTAVGEIVPEIVPEEIVPEEEPARPSFRARRAPPPPTPSGTLSRSVPPPPLPPTRSGTISSMRPPMQSSRELGSRRPPARSDISQISAPRTTPEGAALVELLTARAERLQSADDRVGLARLYLELAIVQETLGDDGRVNAAIEAALKVDPDLGPAHAILRRRIHHRAQLAAMLRHLDHEIEVASGEASTVELLVERARLLVAGDQVDEARDAWELVLGRAPHHAAALKGLEGDLGTRAYVPQEDGSIVPTTDEDRWEDLVAHLGRMADAYSAQADLAAWLHVERARILELRLGRVDAARGAFERALRLDSGMGPVRDAFVLHCAAHHDTARLSALISEEARLEANPLRGARLELDAACLFHTVLGDEARAITLLEQAAARAPTTSSVDRRVLDDLVRLYESSGQWPEATRTRRARLSYFTDAASQVYELKRLASIEEKLGNVDAAIHDIERALSIDYDDTTLASELDRLLAFAGHEEERVSLWHSEAQRAEEGAKRARALAKAAQIAETLGRHEEALRHLRAAWVAAPGDSEILDQLSRLMSPAPTESFDREVRALIELYSQAAQTSRDLGRRVAYLERVAVLWEELVGDQVRATRTYEEILRLEPTRRGALLGLERTAGRIGDDRALSRALHDEAKLAEDGVDVLGLRVRSAQVLARVDPIRASSLVQEVLEQDQEHVGARVLETRLHEEAGRWELATQSLKARIGTAATTNEKVALWLSLAQIYDVRLRDPKSAVAALQEARRTDPIHPVPPEEIARVLEAAGDARALRTAIEQLAHDAITPQERARHLMHAAEIDELRLLDDTSAASLYARALAETPEDEWIADRYVRVLARRVVTSGGARSMDSPELAPLFEQLERRTEKAATPAQAVAASFALASLLVAANREPSRARVLLERVLAVESRHVGALRLLEALARRSGDGRSIAEALQMQGDAFTDVRARLGALWELASLEAWRLPAGESVATYTRILELDATDPSALGAAVRLALGPARRGEVPARRAAIAALRSLSALAYDEPSRIATDLRLGLLLETHASDPTSDRETMTAASHEALERLREALSLDPLSVTAATSLARLANRLGDASGAAAAAMSLAELSVQPKVRSRYLVDAANMLLSDSAEDALGPLPERTERAAQLLERALEADPNSTMAATRLAQVRSTQRESDRLIDVFRNALARATAKDTIVYVGTEIARVARDHLSDVGVAIEAMRAVRAAAPEHVPSLLMLSELFITQRAWPEAVEALEDIVAHGTESGPRITALFALASVYEKVLGEPSLAERALRTAIGIEPENPRAIRALVHRLAAKQNEPDADKASAKREIASLLERLAHVEKDRHVQSDILLELADIRIGLRDMPAAEKALVEVVATAPDHARAFARLSRFFRSPQGLDAVSYARALSAVMVRGAQLGTSDPRWFASLGHIEIEQLGRLRDGVAHLQHAVQMDPSLHECRFELASAYSRLGAHDDAAKAVLAMVTPTAQALVSISDPAAALELLERAFNAERRHEEAIVVSELRAIAGELDDGRQAWLRARRLPPFEQHHAILDRATLVSHVVPPEGRHVLLDVAAAISGLETKLLRADITEIGISARDRIGRRSGHPTRNLLDRLGRALGGPEVELVITPNVSRTRVLAQDGLWVVVPRALTELPEPTQLASLGRALARISLGVPWLEELPPPHIEAMLIAAARSVQPAYAELDTLAMKLVMQYEPNIGKELSRRQRQALEKLVPLMASPHGRIIPIDVLIGALARAELRIAYLLTGDVLATIDELRGLDPAFLEATEQAGRSAVAAVMDHPFAGDVVRFALTPEATALRRRVGSTWAG
jgi:cellulose synthase operon protein C